MRTSAIPAGQLAATADQRVLIHGVSWSCFEAQLEIRGESSAPRIAYLSGTLEIMSPSKYHERIKSVIGHLVEAYALDAGIPFSACGAWTLKREVQDAGAEPDECYIVGLDQEREAPDLVIEVVWTTGGLDKLEIYRRLGIGEFWQWKDGRIEVHVLRRGRYERARRSALLPGLDLDLLVSCLDSPTHFHAIRTFREALARPVRPVRPRGRRG